VDRKAQTVVLPVHGFAVPFHINTIKNVSKNDEGDFTYLRVNFQTPGQLAGKKEDTVRRSQNLCCLLGLCVASPSKIPMPPSSVL
jgi:nucleosome binding factor SPN SPT16 subunit